MLDSPGNQEILQQNQRWSRLDSIARNYSDFGARSMLRRCTSLSSNQNQIYKAGISGGIASVFARYKSRPVTLSKDSGFLASTQVIPKSISSSLLTERDILIFSSLNSLSSMICRALNGPAMFYGQLLTSGDFKRSNRIVRNEHRLIRN